MIHCFQCRTLRSWHLIGSENGDRPASSTYRCTVCGYTRLEFADVTDVLALCRHIVNRKKFSGSLPDNADIEDAVGNLYEAAYMRYRRWNPALGVSFQAYASGMLPRDFANWQRQELGRDVPKAHANAVSLDAPIDDQDDRLGRFITACAPDFALDHDPDAARAHTG